MPGVRQTWSPGQSAHEVECHPLEGEGGRGRGREGGEWGRRCGGRDVWGERRNEIEGGVKWREGWSEVRGAGG